MDRVYTYTIPEKYIPELSKMINDMDTERFNTKTVIYIPDIFKTIRKWEPERIDLQTGPYLAEGFTTTEKVQKDI